MSKITICGSIAFLPEMKNIQSQLEKLNHTVYIPQIQLKNELGDIISLEEFYILRNLDENKNNPNSWIWDRKNDAILEHFKKIENSDSILVLNYKKGEIDNYIGANTFLEMGVALQLKKLIYLLNDIPNQSNKEELLGLKPVIINNNLDLIK